MLSRKNIWLLVALALLPVGGCFHAEAPQHLEVARHNNGLVIVLTGVEGTSAFNKAIVKGLEDGGIDWAIQLEDWTAYATLPGGAEVGMGPLWNQRARDRNYRKAGEIAGRIVRYQQQFPERPVVLVGQSGGGAMAAWICEQMPSGRSVTGVIMLAASLSPDYSLERALVHSERGIVSFYSSRDWVMLGVGTTIAGTMDGQWSQSAGHVGFRPPVASGRQGLYRMLYQVPWNPEMSQSGYTGMHLSSGAANFVRQYVVPLINNPDWSQESVDKVTHRSGRPKAED